jgi:hypothetical protein
VEPSYARRRLSVLALGSAFLIVVAVALASDEVSEPADTGSATTSEAAPRATPETTLDVDALGSSDTFDVAPGEGPRVGSGERYTYTVEVEAGVPVDPVELAAVVEAALSDPRGWTATGRVALQRVGPGATPRFRVRLATPDTTDARCAPLETNGEVSCRNGEDVMINLRRWLEGAAPSGLSLADYRTYLVNHEVGHALGHDHVDCPGAGQVAPIMLQQTLGLGGCTPNPWPNP